MKYWLRAYYGPGGRKGGKNRPGEREGDIVIEVWNTNESMRNAEVARILRKREDVGVIDTWETDR